MLIGYARVSTIDLNPALQMDALKTAGCDKVFTEKASGSHRDRPQLKAALNYLREGDTLVVWGRVASITGQARSTLTRENGQPTDSNLAQPSSVILLRARTPICASVF